MSLATPAILRRALLLSVLASALAGCGQTGPLYLPEDAATDSSTGGPDDETEEDAADEERRSP